MGAGRAEGGEGVKERGAGKGGGRELEREVKEVGGGRGARQEGREGGRERMCTSTEEWEGQNAAERERGEGEVKDRGREHEEEAEEEGRERRGGREGGRDQLMPDGFQQNKCVFT